ncbi:MAG: PEGA domain-containing protein [Deltaproteobacteria bacterium]|nr:PEGA domain-containing protein [Deltaproteobacteria bacterium]
MLPTLLLLVAAEKAVVTIAVLGVAEPEPLLGRVEAKARTLGLMTNRISLPTGETKKTVDVSIARLHLDRATAAFRGFRLAAAKAEVDLATRALEAAQGRPEARAVDRELLFVAASIAHAQRDDAGLSRALAAYARRFSDEPPPPESGWPPALRARLEELSPKARFTLTITATQDARVYVDGRELGRGPTSVDVTPGAHRVVIQTPGFREIDRALEVSESTKLEEDLSIVSEALALAELPLLEPLRAAVLSRASGDALVLLDGRKRRVARIALTPLGRTFGAREDATYEDAPQGLELALESLLSIPEPPSAGVPVWAWAVLASGVVAVGAGTALRMDAVGAQKDLEIRASALTQARAFALDGEAQSTATTGSILIGLGTAAVVGFATWLLTDQVLE